MLLNPRTVVNTSRKAYFEQVLIRRLLPTCRTSPCWRLRSSQKIQKRW